MNNTNFTERVTIKSILLPSPCTNYEGLTTVTITSIDENKIIQQNPAKCDFVIYKNISFKVTIVHKNKVYKTPNDLTGFTVEGKAFLINNKEIEFDLHPRIDDDPTTGKIIIELTPEETNSIFLDEKECITYYHYFINLISSTGYNYRILIGNIKACQ